ncbi:ChaB1 [Hyposidra talaca nucleopolyhedrovirus]|uniref:ChaB1 n=1 Tax=Hyposidra talaca nucleopolyhedrovirus TaxID=1070315 RepID=A0A2Z4HHZ8_9ABAC|nr:ChaB1 [Hyposidra talaca nucleopolyhedrovirus]AWW14403.1 ChaB1 [Hyposidra talaca nucleopolyhedrovirus]
MDYLVNVQFKNELPGRAKRLYMNTFRRHHKLNGGDENVAMYLAQRAVEKDYVKLNNQWLPKEAARLIVRHNMSSSENDDDDDYSDSNRMNKKQKLISGNGDGGNNKIQNSNSAKRKLIYSPSNRFQLHESNDHDESDDNDNDHEDDYEDNEDEDDDNEDDDNEDIAPSQPSQIRFQQRNGFF